MYKPMKEIVIPITAHRLSEKETGLWCRTCNLPSVASASVVIQIDGRPHEVVAVSVCEDCGEVQH